MHQSRFLLHYSIGKLIFQYFGGWREKTADAIEQNKKESEMLEEANTQLEHLKLVRILSSWRKYVSLSVVQRTSEEKARLHYNRVVQTKCFISWYDHHRLQLRKRLLQRQGAWFEHNRLLSFAYSKWRIQVSLLTYAKDQHIICRAVMAHAYIRVRYAERAWREHCTYVQINVKCYHYCS